MKYHLAVADGSMRNRNAADQHQPLVEPGAFNVAIPPATGGRYLTLITREVHLSDRYLNLLSPETAYPKLLDCLTLLA